MAFPSLDRVTLCCIDTDHPAAGLRAIRQCLAQCRFNRSLFFTSQPFSEPGVECQVIPRFRTLKDYSAFVLKGLASNLTTDFVFMIHWDGYMIDGSLWSDDFLKFDYIGAPWPWKNEYRVGNGGFSIRSRRLVQLLADSPMRVVHPEDVAICQRYRDVLENVGIRFADVDTAFRFAVERGEPPGPTLGFHGVFNFWRFLPQRELGPLLDLLPPSYIHADVMSELLTNYLSLGRHEEALEIISRRQRGDPFISRF